MESVKRWTMMVIEWISVDSIYVQQDTYTVTSRISYSKIRVASLNVTFDSRAYVDFQVLSDLGINFRH